MRRLHKFLRLPAAERLLLIRAALLLGGIKLGLKLLPFQAVQRFLEKLGEVSVGLCEMYQTTPERVVWAVELAGRYVHATCLTQALAARVLLVRRGHSARIHIGVTGGGEKFLAHAWVESGGQVIIGGHELERYVPLTVLEGKNH